MNELRIAVLLATYNGEMYISEQLHSLLVQSYTNFEIYISDDGSTDRTNDIIFEFANKYPAKIHILNNKERFGGACGNFLSLLKRVEADLYFFCDQDDVWDVDKIKKTIDLYTKINVNNEPLLIHTDLRVVDKSLKVLDESYMSYMKKPHVLTWKQYLVENNNVVGCTMAINRTLAEYYKKSSAVIENENILMHDAFFSILAAVVGRIYYINEQTLNYRQHDSNSVGAKKPQRGCLLFLSKLKNISEYRELQRKRERHINEILKCIFEHNYKTKILEQYVNLNMHNKIFRIYWIIKNKVYRIGFKKNVYLLFII